VTRRRLMVAAAIHAAALLAAPASHSVDTTIKGARMELVDKGEEVVFTGGVRLERGTDTVIAKTMRTNKARDRVAVKGDVRLTRLTSATETWKAFGDSGFYNTKDGTGYLVGAVKRAHMTRTEVLSSTSSRYSEIYADRIDFVREGQRAFAQGHVYGKMADPDTGDVYEFNSEEAEHRGDEGRIILTGPTTRPVITQNGPRGFKRVTGKTIIYYIDRRKLISTNNAEAVLQQVK
jgi:lipopolysaccharide export system protein LptA